MNVEPVLKALEKIAPTSVIAFFGICLYFMKNNYEIVVKNCREENHNQKEVYRDQIAGLRSDINMLREDNNKLKEESRSSADEVVKLRQEMISLIKDLPNIGDALKKVFSSMQDGVDLLSSQGDGSDNKAINQLKEEIQDLQTSLKDFEKIDDRTRIWLKQIEELSTSKKSWASEANQYSRQAKFSAKSKKGD